MTKWILLSIIIAFAGLVDLFVILFVIVSWSFRWVWHHRKRLIPCVFLLFLACDGSYTKTRVHTVNAQLCIDGVCTGTGHIE